MKPPVEFQQRLGRLFDHRLRCRWSPQREEWQIEAKIARGQQFGFPVQEDDDATIRARDGYAYVMSIRTGDRMPCPRCGGEVSVPLFKVGDISCDYCKMQGRQNYIPACYFPLDSDALIHHLIRYDPLRTYRDNIAKDADAHNEALKAQRMKQFEADVRHQAIDDFRTMVHIPMTGYTGRERYQPSKLQEAT